MFAHCYNTYREDNLTNFDLKFYGQTTLKFFIAFKIIYIRCFKICIN